MTRTSLIHANRMWSDAVSVFLWPYDLKHANECINVTPFPGNMDSPIEKFTGLKVTTNYNDIHPFACPAYALDGRVQGGQKAPKWGTRARIAIYLGPSTTHARSVGNLLSLTTGLVSPQFHVRYDDTFQTLRNSTIMRSVWQELAGFANIKFIERRQSSEAHIPRTERPDIDQEATNQQNQVANEDEDNLIEND
jgi:hypothetical protein